MEKGQSQRDQFWEVEPQYPPEIRSQRIASIPVSQRGPGGLAILDLVEISSPGGSVGLLIFHKSPLLAKDVPRLRERLLQVIDERFKRETSAKRNQPFAVLPALATNRATPSVVEACLRERVALLDQAGTLLIHGAPVFIHIIGKGPVEVPNRVRLFRGKACRIVRALLLLSRTPRSIKAMAELTDTSYAYANATIRKLEEEGFIARRSPRGGVYLDDPVGLMRAWVTSGVSTAVAVQPYYCPSTRGEVLRCAFDAVSERTGARPLFTLASALDSEELHVSGLPHGVYLSGSEDSLIEALDLRRTTPHNFFVLRADPAAETEAGGLYMGIRVGGPCGDRVSLPQLIVDFAHIGGRGPEQAESLLQRYTESLPTLGATDD